MGVGGMKCSTLALAADAAVEFLPNQIFSAERVMCNFRSLIFQMQYFRQ